MRAQHRTFAARQPNIESRMTSVTARAAPGPRSGRGGGLAHPGRPRERGHVQRPEVDPVDGQVERRDDGDPDDQPRGSCARARRISPAEKVSTYQPS
jgi:hypothetical protein